jgi:transcriptional regulator with XRE-family HTH domain
MKKRTDARDTEIGARLRALRLERGLSQSVLAGHLGLSFQQLQKYEKGINRVSAARLATIADFLGAPVTFFYDGLGARGAKQAAPTFAYLTGKGATRLLRAYAQIAAPGAKGALVTLAEALKGKKGRSA